MVLVLKTTFIIKRKHFQIRAIRYLSSSPQRRPRLRDSRTNRYQYVKFRPSKGFTSTAFQYIVVLVYVLYTTLAFKKERNIGKQETNPKGFSMGDRSFIFISRSICLLSIVGRKFGLQRGWQNSSGHPPLRRRQLGDILARTVSLHERLDG